MALPRTITDTEHVDLYAVEPTFGNAEELSGPGCCGPQAGNKIFFDAAKSRRSETSLGLESAIAGLVSRHAYNITSIRFSPFKPSFYGKAGGQPLANDPFEALEDPHAPCG